MKETLAIPKKPPPPQNFKKHRKRSNQIKPLKIPVLNRTSGLITTLPHILIVTSSLNNFNSIKNFKEIDICICIYRVFRAQADLTVTHTSHNDTEQSTIKASITVDGVTLTDSVIRWPPNEWPSVCREIPVSADKMFWASNKLAKWTFHLMNVQLTVHQIKTVK
jgi:hypothetical protein